MNNFLQRLFMYLSGIVIIAFSIALIVKVDVGAGAWDALNVGLSQVIGFTVGTWVFIIGFLLIFFNAWLMKVKPQYLAMITVVINGLVIDFWLYIVFQNIYIESLYVRVGLFIIGTITLAIGISMYLQAKFPPVPIDNLMIAIQRRTGVNLMIAKTIGEISALVLALIFQGPIGFGTIVITLLLGPIIQFFFPKFEMMMMKWTQPKGTYS
ncbi:YczE/YyaS/YitT family protein [Bacillus sp. Marseille-P3661]|uniref:YczE/YyaS/YitT family protein n=1 Tax=Bacillus sp. Marseille-P3661 TaxID=1936234 RepID=UPI000C867F96